MGINFICQLHHVMPGKRNPEDKSARLIGAVGEILSEKGYQGLGLNKIALAAGVSKPMVYRYFDGLNGLLKAYVQHTDSWLPYFQALELPQHPTTEDLKTVFTRLLQAQFRFMRTSKEMQQLIIWEISEVNPLMRSSCEAREKHGARLLELTEQHFRNSGVSLKAVLALLVGGVYFSVLHDSAQGGTLAGIDLKSEKDFEAMLKAVEQIIAWAFDRAAVKE
jgi:AcrR family transcriptional regulator